MFLEDIKDVYSLFNEAEDDSVGEANEFQMDTSDAPEPDAEDTQNNANESEVPDPPDDTEDTTNEDGTDQFQMDMGDAPEDDGTEDNSGTDDTADASSSEPIEIKNPTKKYTLLLQYKDLLDTVEKLRNAVANLFKKKEIEEEDDIMYILKQIDILNTNIAFTIVNKFDKMEYNKLLKLYFYYQDNCNHITSLLEKAIDILVKE